MRPVPIPAELEDDNWQRRVIAPPLGHDPFESEIGTVEALVGFVEQDGVEGIAITTHWVLEPEELGTIMACVGTGQEARIALTIYADALPPASITVEIPR